VNSNETTARVIKGDQNHDVSDHKEQPDLFAQFYESLAIPSNEEHNCCKNSVCLHVPLF
jgi:hypothetical protein